MAARDSASTDITPEVLLRAYACGIFPMAESADDPTLHWIEPVERGIIPLDTFYVQTRLARTVRSDRFRVTVNTCFDDVMAQCAGPRRDATGTWINDRIRALYHALHQRGFCHSVEVWADGTLAGGLYGVCMGRAFFGESMFHIVRDASKVALVHLVARLLAGGFVLLDTQFVTSHLARFGAIEVSRTRYRELLDAALLGEADFFALGRNDAVSGAAALAAIDAHTTVAPLGDAAD